MIPLRALAFCCVVALFGAASASASPTPVPGGANQVNAIPGKVGDTLWNGVVRFKVVEVRDATPADHPESVVPLAGQKVMVITAIIRNGTPSTWSALVTYTLADKDDVSITVPSVEVKPVTLDIQQGATAKQTALFAVDKSFVPVKLIFQCSTCGKGGFKAFRVTIPSPSQ